MTIFGQVVLGPPASGKTTYCTAIAKLLQDLGRKVAIVNLDPGNEEILYETVVNICDLVNVDDVMQTKQLGPNGALIYCMELLHQNLQWLTEHINQLKDHYLIFDFPGQAELYTHHEMIRDIFATLEKQDIRLCSVFMVDSHHANDPGKYISAVLLALNSMLHVEIPTVNILSKIDLMERYGELQFGLEFYTDVLDLDYLIDSLDGGPLTRKYQKLNKAIAEIVTDYSLVSFIPLSVENRSTLLSVMKAVDKANGYIYGTKEERNILKLLSSAVGAEWEHDRIGSVRDQYMGGSDDDEHDENLLRTIAMHNVDN